jgi:eukaryotic-like serine/threonine-protein kinase
VRGQGCHDIIDQVNVKIEHNAQSGLTKTVEHSADASLAMLEMTNDILPIGTKICDYSIRGVISCGGFGTVYRASHIESGRPAAIKVLHPELIAHDNDAIRFKREVEIIRRLQHPNVVNVFDFGQLPYGRPFFVMELLSGETLEHRLLSRDRLTIDETLEILEPLASALDLAHSQSVIHRDLKPSNVFLSNDKNGKTRVVLLDFGVAKVLDQSGQSLTASRQIIGTLSCMSPEQLLGEKIDLRTDIYAVGILAYAMITGKAPFEVGALDSDNPVVFLYARYVRPVAPSQHVRIDPALDAPILRALAQDPTDRPASVGEFVASLKAAIRRTAATNSRPDGAKEREGIAVHVEVNVDSSAMEEPDDALLLDLETVLPSAASILNEAGLIPIVETGNNLLLVIAAPDDPSLWSSLRKRVVETVTQAYERSLVRPGRDMRIRLTFAATSGSLVTNADGALIDGGLLDPTAWLPAYQGEGVLLSKTLTEGLEVSGRIVPEAPDFIVTGAS